MTTTPTNPAPTVRVGCPGCGAPLDVSAEPTEATWLDDEQWCADCRVEPEAIETTNNNQETTR